MLKARKNTSFQGQSTATKKTAEGEEQVIVVNLYGSVSEDGTVNIGETIVDMEIYEANKKAAEADIAAFRKEILGGAE